MKKSSRGRFAGESESRISIYERVTERVVELLNQGVIPWQKPWSVQVGRPRNGATGRYYRGLNVFMLSAMGYGSPWWFTPKQVNDLPNGGGHIKKGERVSWVQFWARPEVASSSE